MNDFLQKILLLVVTWSKDYVFVQENLVQLVIVAVVGLLSLWVANKVKKPILTQVDLYSDTKPRLSSLLSFVVPLVPFVCFFFTLLTIQVSAQVLELPYFILKFIVTICLAGILIKATAAIVFDKFWGKLISFLAWVIASLHILGFLVPLTDFLDSLGFTFGKLHLSVLSILKAGIVFSLLLLFGNWLASFLEKKLKTVDNLNPSTHVLLSKIIKISVFFVVILLALNSAGIDLTTFAVFGGAIGVGIGFGLQKVVGNFVSGVILLLDKSIKPGDVIQVGGVYGWISDLRGRYASIVTRDGKEYLIPNEDLITQQVINLSFSDRLVRFKIPFGVSYASDPHMIIKIALSVLDNVSRVLVDPKPKCLLKGFGDNSIDFELRFWVKDPENGRSNIKSEIMLKLWDILAEHDIEIPFPQRDVNLNISEKTLQKLYLFSEKTNRL